MEVSLTKMPKDTTLTINVRLTRRFRFRVWLGLLVMKIGTRILGAAPEVHTAQLEMFKCSDVVPGEGPFSNAAIYGLKTDDKSEPVRQLFTEGSVVSRQRTGDSIRLVVAFDSNALRKGDVFCVDGENA